ncbi:MAG: hypothetical protein EHM45_07905 [Desulfobacteraceae bacterium]|nr:MAG: hypothetical protein EHM45_07905 [Desulfobacteraceae bacterium]
MSHGHFSVKSAQGSYDLEAVGQWIGSDLLVAIWGGERPHIGAVAVAQPRPSLKNPENTSATASVFCYVGHKEDELAKSTAETLAAALNTHVVVTVGIHWDDLPTAGIQQVIKNSGILVERILAQIS